MILGAALVACAAVVPSFLPVRHAGAGPADGVWTGQWRGHVAVLVLRERHDGRLVGYLPADPSTWVTAGRRSGRRVTIDFAGDDGAHSWTATLAGNIGGASLAGPVAFSDTGHEAAHFRRSSIPNAIEHWIVADTGEGHAYRLPRVVDSSGAFVSGGYVQTEGCSVLGCSGVVTGWSEVGLSHVVTVTAAPDCPSPASLSGSWDAAELLLQGTWSRAALACRAAGGGPIMGGKEGLAAFTDVADVLALLATFADAVEAESPAAANAFAVTYLNDGLTRSDWQALLADLYAGYASLEARVTEIRQVVTGNDGEVNPRVLWPPRLEWHLVVTGVPAGGGGRVTVLDRQASFTSDQELCWIDGAGTGMVFVGNRETEPFRLELPIAAGAQAFAAFGIWPYGVHGGGHPEGHPGIDVEFKLGALVRASAAGTIDRIEPNGEFAGQSDLLVRHRPSYATRYGHVGVLAAGISSGAAVTAGQPLGAAGDTGNGVSHHYITHWGMDRGVAERCPIEFLSPAAAAQFDTIWVNASYPEELTEPFPCNPLAVSFPLTRTWTRTSGSLAPRIDFIRLDPTTGDYRYVLRDSNALPVGSGSVSSLQVNPGPAGGLIDLQPDSGPVRLGRYRITSSQLLISWGATRPADLTGATVYSTTAP